MKTKLIITLLTAALVLAGCGRKKDEVPADTPAPTEAAAEEPTPEPTVTEAADPAETDKALPEDVTKAPEDPEDEEDPDLDDPELQETYEEPGDGTTVQDPSELDEELPDYLREDFEPTASDGSGGTGEGAGKDAGSTYEPPKELKMNPCPSDPVAIDGAAGRYTVALTSAKKAQTSDGASCLEISFSFANETVSSQILIDTLNLALIDSKGTVLPTVAEDNPTLTTLEPASTGDTRSFTVKYYLTAGENKFRLIYTDLNDGSIAGWEIDLKKL